MGVLRLIMDNDEGHPAAVGGMVSPGGVVAIGDSAAELGASPVIAIRRIHMDYRIVQAAQSAGARLIEGFDVVDACLDKSAGEWTIGASDGGIVRARVMVAADGANSRLARRLGLVTEGAEAVCSRAYVEADTSDFAFDGVAFYRRDLLPGYCALFRESRGQLNFCLYLIPGGDCRPRDLRRMHDQVLREDPFVSRALGPRARIGAMKGAPLRLGGVARSWDDHLIVLGDAAGQIDPLTGEGIQYAMDAAEIASNTIVGCLDDGDLGADRLRRYHLGWQRAFGSDFAWSARIAALYGRHPGLLDAGARALRDAGSPLLAKWAEVMTGAKPKTHFLRPEMVVPMLRSAVRHAFAAHGGPDYAAIQRGPAQSGPDQSGPAQSGPDQSGPDQSGPAQSRRA
jgi:flavin-dependent dehydrogenase